MGAWTGLIWLRTGTGGGHLWMRQWTSGLHKMRWISRLAEHQLISQEGLCSMELVKDYFLHYNFTLMRQVRNGLSMSQLPLSVPDVHPSNQGMCTTILIFPKTKGPRLRLWCDIAITRLTGYRNVLRRDRQDWRSDSDKLFRKFWRQQQQ